MDKERKAFEKWLLEGPVINPIKNPDGSYAHSFAKTAWQAWQARAALDGKVEK